VLPIPLRATPEPSIKVRKRDRDRAERIRLAGGSKPSVRERAVALALEMGVVRTKHLTDIGIPRCYLARMCNEGLLVKVGYGRYRAAVPKRPFDARYERLLKAQDADAVVPGWVPRLGTRNTDVRSFLGRDRGRPIDGDAARRKSALRSAARFGRRVEQLRARLRWWLAKVGDRDGRHKLSRIRMPRATEQGVGRTPLRRRDFQSRR